MITGVVYQVLLLSLGAEFDTLTVIVIRFLCRLCNREVRAGEECDAGRETPSPQKLSA